MTEVHIVAVNETGPDKLTAEINEAISEKNTKSCVKTKNDSDVDEDLSEIHHKCSENKENDPKTQSNLSLDSNKGTLHALDERNEDSNREISESKSSGEDLDAEILKRAQDEGCVSVAFPGTITQDGCCRFVSEILKCVLYQRQQLPMTYDQLVYSQKKLQASVQDKDTVKRRPADMDWRKCQQTLQELEEVLQHLEVLFSLSRVPRVLLLMGGTLLLPKEFYEINMEALVLASGEKSLRVSSCLRQVFRNLFVADFLSDTKPVRLMPTTVMVLAHRDCGVDWFRPKQQFKVPTRVKSKVIALSTDLCSGKDLQRDELDGNDYIWFQAPMTIKGFSNRKA
uniref:MAD2L1-binding protein n=1 Tax=Knipowitschia caucasica TaxID=637954 RepID=A0AAV2JL48_KNICA